MSKSAKHTLVVLLPCLNESETLAICIKKAQSSIQKSGLSGVVLVSDNGSTDGSQEIAKSLGAKLILVQEKGYGSALSAGIAAANSDFVIMGDSDDSYALDDLDLFIQGLLNGDDLVIGNRFRGGIAPGAMPWLHKYLGNPVLSGLGRLFFQIPIKDFHCGLRGFRTDRIRDLNLTSTGMEFASEMVVKAQLNGLKISEVPTKLKKDGRSRPPHLRSWRDGWRHLIFLLAASPRWLFLYPGLFILSLGILGTFSTADGNVNFGKVILGSNTYFLSLGLILVGMQTILLGILARIFSSKHGFLPKSKNSSFVDKVFTLERGITLGLFLIAFSLIGLGILFVQLTFNGTEGFDSEESLRISGLLVTILLSGIQLVFYSFFASLLQV
jgi:glycosyltransferase involved in cell wall biosynthesis